jgi:hypothetical protein
MGAVDVLKSRTAKKAIQDRFVERTLESGARNIIEDQKRIESRYNVARNIPEISRRRYQVSGNTLQVHHPIRQRFIDMRRVKGKRQKPIRIHNRPIYTGFNRMISQLVSGFTEDIKNLIANDYKIQM